MRMHSFLQARSSSARLMELVLQLASKASVIPWLDGVMGWLVLDSGVVLLPVPAIVTNPLHLGGHACVQIQPWPFRDQFKRVGPPVSFDEYLHLAQVSTWMGRPATVLCHEPRYGRCAFVCLDNHTTTGCLSCLSRATYGMWPRI